MINDKDIFEYIIWVVVFVIITIQLYIFLKNYKKIENYKRIMKGVEKLSIAEATIIEEKDNVKEILEKIENKRKEIETLEDPNVEDSSDDKYDSYYDMPF